MNGHDIDTGTLRAAEFPYLDATGQAYLDHAGSGLPPLSLVQGHRDRLAGAAFGNPHSFSPASAESTRLVEEARAAVLRFFRADPGEYTVIFTANATAALRLVGEAFPFGDTSVLLLTGDNHNSVLGIRRYAARTGARVQVIPPQGEELRTDPEAVTRALNAGGDTRAPSLFAWPAQSNATGTRHPLEWVEQARRHGWRVLLDAASFVPTSRLDLSRVRPDYVAVSWYKVSGYPPGVGCLVARHEALEILRRPWFAGGTVLASSSHTDWQLYAPGPERFEDGTLPFLCVPDVTAALDWHRRIGYPRIEAHTAGLTSRLLDGLQSLRHSGGEPAVRVHGTTGTELRGPTVAFNLLDERGGLLDERTLGAVAARAGVSVRTGCFCNPGVGEAINALSPAMVGSALRRGQPAGIDGYVKLLGVRAVGAVRASVGVASNVEDIDRLLQVVAGTAATRSPSAAGHRSHC